MTVTAATKSNSSILQKHPNAIAQLVKLDIDPINHPTSRVNLGIGSAVWIPHEKCLYTVSHVPVAKIGRKRIDGPIAFCVAPNQGYTHLQRYMRNVRGNTGNLTLNNLVLKELDTSLPGTEAPFISDTFPPPAHARAYGYSRRGNLENLPGGDAKSRMSGGPVMNPNTGEVYALMQGVYEEKGQPIPNSSVVVHPKTGQQWQNSQNRMTGTEPVITVQFDENGRATVRQGPISSRSAPPPAVAPRPRTTPEPPQQDETPGPGIPNHTLKWQRPCREVLKKFAEAFGPANVTDAPDFKNGSVITDPNTNDAYLLQDEPLNGGSACVNMGGASTASLKDNPIYQRMR